MAVFVCGSVTTITRNCCIDPHQTGFVDKGSDHLQPIKFWPSRAPGKGSAAGRNFLAPPYYSQRAVFASLRALFCLLLMHGKNGNGYNASMLISTSADLGNVIRASPGRFAAVGGTLHAIPPPCR